MSKSGDPVDDLLAATTDGYEANVSPAALKEVRIAGKRKQKNG